MKPIRIVLAVLCACTAASCSQELTGTPVADTIVAESPAAAPVATQFDPCSIPASALDGVGMKAKPRKDFESTVPAAVSCTFQGINGTLGIMWTAMGSADDLKIPGASDVRESRVGERTILGVTMPSRGTINSCIQLTQTVSGWISLSWAGSGDVCALSDAAFIAIDPLLPQSV